MNEWCIGAGFGVNCQLTWVKSRRSHLQSFWLKIKKKMIKVNNLHPPYQALKSGVVVQSLMSLASWPASGSNLAEVCCNHFGLK